MATPRWFIKVFNLRQDESKPVLYLMIFSFFVGLSMSFYFAASNAIFLKHFQSWMISVSYMASGMIVWTAWWILSRLDRKLNLSWQLIVKFLFVFLTVSAISAGVWLYDTPVLVFIMFTWVRILTYVTLVTFWGLAGKLFNIRQGKRIFGLIGTGEVISIIIGYFSIPFLLQFLKAPDLLFLSSGTLLICFIMVFVILRVFKDQLTGKKEKLNTTTAVKKPAANYRELIRKPYFLLISFMALLPIFGYLFVDFLFLSQTKREFANNPETIAGFFGIFLGFVAVIELILKLFSGRFLSKFGIKPSLLSLPLILLSTIFVAAVFGTFYGTIGLFFAFISLARLFERSVRSAIYEPAFQLLYQPVPSDQRMIFQNQIEGIPKAFGTVVTGAVILLFSAIHSFNLVHYNWFFILVLGLWIWIAVRMYEAYRNTLKTKLHELKTESSIRVQSVSDVIRQALKNAGPEQFEKIHRICDIAEPILTDEVLQHIFPEVSEHVKLIIIRKMTDKQMVSAIGFLKKEWASTESGTLKTVMEAAIEYLKPVESIPLEDTALLCKSEKVSERLEAAWLLGSSGRYNTFRLLHALMKDPDSSVRRAAVISCGRIKRYELWPLVTEYLFDPEFAHSAMIAIQHIGEPFLPELDRLFEKSNGKTFVQIRILRVLESIGGQKSIRLLRDKIFHSNKDIRNQVLISLSHRRYHAAPSEVPYLKGLIEESVEYILWIMASLQDLVNTGEAGDLQMALMSELEEQKEHVFLLLSLLYESKTIHHIREHIESKDANAKVYALEISDMMIDTDIKELYFPVFEDLTFQERLNRFGNRFPQEKLGVVDRLYDILNKEYNLANRYTKACALVLLGKQKKNDSFETERMLAANLVHPDRMLGELSALSLYHYNRSYYYEITARLKNGGNAEVALTGDKIQAHEDNREMLFFEKVILLRNTALFETVPETDIIIFLTQYPEPGSDDAVRTSPAGQNRPAAEYLTTGDGNVIAVSRTGLYEFMMSTPELAARFFRSIQNITTN